MNHAFAALCALLLAVAALPAHAVGAVVKVNNAWARATAPGQPTAAAYVELTSDTDAALVAVNSTAAGRVEIHSTTMEGSVMRMRPVARMELPAGKTVKLEPGGAHLMLLELKRPLKAGEKLPLTLSVQRSGAAPTTIEVQAVVRAGGHTPHAH